VKHSTVVNYRKMGAMQIDKVKGIGQQRLDGNTVWRSFSHGHVAIKA